MGYSPRGHKESDTTERLSLSHFLFTRDCTFFPVKYVLELIAKEMTQLLFLWHFEAWSLSSRSEEMGWAFGCFECLLPPSPASKPSSYK